MLLDTKSRNGKVCLISFPFSWKCKEKEKEGQQQREPGGGRTEGKERERNKQGSKKTKKHTNDRSNEHGSVVKKLEKMQVTIIPHTEPAT